MSQQPEQNPTRPETVTGAGESVTVRRAPKYYRFMLVGLVVGVIVTVVATFSFPEQDDFSQIQVLGFTGIFVVAICVGLGAVVAIVLDRASRRRARTVSVEHTREGATAAAEIEPGADAQ